MTTRHTKVAQLATILAETIQALGEVPSGHLYAHVMQHVDLEVYQAAIDVLVRAKLVKNSNHLLTWIGPTLTKEVVQ